MMVHRRATAAGKLEQVLTSSLTLNCNPVGPEAGCIFALRLQVPVGDSGRERARVWTGKGERFVGVRPKI